MVKPTWRMLLGESLQTVISWRGDDPHLREIECESAITYDRKVSEYVTSARSTTEEVSIHVKQDERPNNIKRLSN